MNPTLPPRRSLLLSTGSGDRRRGKVYERLAHKNSDTPGAACSGNYSDTFLRTPNTMKPKFSRIAIYSKAVLACMAITLSASSFAGDVAAIGYELPANGATIQVRKVETNALDAQK
jgi:hypothetical protein